MYMKFSTSVYMSLYIFACEFSVTLLRHLRNMCINAHASISVYILIHEYVFTYMCKCALTQTRIHIYVYTYP